MKTCKRSQAWENTHKKAIPKWSQLSLSNSESLAIAANRQQWNGNCNCKEDDTNDKLTGYIKEHIIG